MTTATPQSLTRLHGLLEVSRIVRDAGDVSSLLPLLAAAVSEFLGYRTVAVNVYRPAWDDFEVAAVHGSDAARAALLGSTAGWDFWRPIVDARFARRGAYFVPAGAHEWTGDASFVADTPPSEGPDAWHPEDALVAPMYASDGRVLGVLSVDEPESGKRPSNEEIDVLVAVAAHTAQALEAAHAETDAARYRRALEHLLQLSAELRETRSTQAVLQSVCEAIRAVLGFELVVVELVDAETDRFRPCAVAGLDIAHEDLQLSASIADLKGIFDPQFEREGCYLLARDEALARVHAEPTSYASSRNGRGPHAWNRHWLIVPFFDRGGETIGFIWVDDPDDQLLPSRQRLQALRLFANAAAQALDEAAQYEALREAHETQRALIEASPAGIVVMNTDATVRSMNPAAEAMLGWRTEEVADCEPPWVPADVMPAFRARFPFMLAGEDILEEEFEDLRKDGSRIDVRTSTAVLRDASGAPTGLIATLTDVTARRIAEDELRRSKELYRAIVESSTDVIALLDLDGRIRYASPSHDDVLGYPQQETIGRSALDLVHPDDVPHAAEMLEAALGDAPSAYLVRARHADGRWLELEGVAAAIRNASGEPEMVLAVARDVTARRRAEDERAKLEEQLRQAQKMEAVGRLAGGIAHDFNNLLTAITGYGDLALAKLPADAPVRRNVEEMKRAGERAADLTRQLLAFSRKQVLQPQVLDLNGVLASIEPMLGRVLGEDVELVTSLAADLGRTRADPGQIEQVVLNLAINGRDAMPRGGRLTIESANVTLDEHAAAQHVDAVPGDYVALTVTDTGEGMDSETLAHAFEPFFTTKPAGQGTGLGLATVYGIVRQTGGYVWAYSEPGHGTAIKVYLPRVWEAAAERPEREPQPRAAGSETILLVEDEEIVRTLVREMLEASGYRVLAAPDGEAALALAEAHPRAIDLLMTDVVMPGLSGQELASRLTAERPGLRVLFTSGYTEDAISNHGVLSPGAAFLEKPFTAAELAQELRGLLDPKLVA